MHTNESMGLVGYTGFVGNNIANKTKFSGLYNSKNIQNSYGTNPDLLVYAGLRAEKFIANKYPEKDMDSIYNAINTIKKINPQKLVLISTIDVYDTPINVNEKDIPNEDQLLPYGKNRLFLEHWVENNFKQYCVVRLPGLFGQNIKKNFIYDMIHIVPSLLTEKNYMELNEKDKRIADFYIGENQGFYKCKPLSVYERKQLICILDSVGFSALNFTDSEGVYQFYNLEHLWGHIELCMEHQISKINMSTEPIAIKELYHFVTGIGFENRITKTPPFYDFRTQFSDIFGGSDGYIENKKNVLNQIKKFVENQRYEKYGE